MHRRISVAADQPGFGGIVEADEATAALPRRACAEIVDGEVEQAGGRGDAVGTEQVAAADGSGEVQGIAAAVKRIGDDLAAGTRIPLAQVTLEAIAEECRGRRASGQAGGQCEAQNSQAFG